LNKKELKIEMSKIVKFAMKDIEAVINMTIEDLVENVYEEGYNEGLKDGEKEI
jgi:flagellar biosynthesis/type III secretory pathway protein FliH